MPPTYLGQYNLETLLGSGEYTDTYHAIDTVRRRPVALKILHADLPVPALRLLPEAAQASELVHPHLAWVWEAAVIDEVAFIAERFFHGAPLFEMLAQAGALTWEDAFQVFCQIAQGLDFAHARKWVHGAVNPKNILINYEAHAVLTDFGLSTALRWSGIVLHNDLYTAPEVWEGQSPSAASDQYALACLLVEMLVGQPLFAAASTEEIRSKHLAGLELLPVDPGGIPWQTVPVLRRALARNPASRYPSLSEMIQTLQRISEQISEDPQERDRRRQASLGWRDEQQIVRRQAEETARLAAVEQARREIEEQVRRESIPIPENTPVTVQQRQPSFSPVEPGILVDDEDDLTLPEYQVLEPPRRRRRRSGMSILWLLALLLLLLILFISLRGINFNFLFGVFIPYTATWTVPVPINTLTPTQLPTATEFTTLPPSLTNTPTSTATGTATPTPTATTASTQTSTITVAPTPIPTLSAPSTPILRTPGATEMINLP